MGDAIGYAQRLARRRGLPSSRPNGTRPRKVNQPPPARTLELAIPDDADRWQYDGGMAAWMENHLAPWAAACGAHYGPGSYTMEWADPLQTRIRIGWAPRHG